TKCCLSVLRASGGGDGALRLYLEEMQFGQLATGKVGIEDGGSQASAEDGPRVQPDLVALHERSSAQLRGMTEDDDTALEIGAAGEDRLAYPQARVQAIGFPFRPGLAGRHEARMDEMVAPRDILHLGRADKLPVRLRDDFPPAFQVYLLVLVLIVEKGLHAAVLQPEQHRFRPQHRAGTRCRFRQGAVAGVEHQLLVVAAQKDDVRMLLSQFQQRFDDGAGVRAPVNVVAEEDERILFLKRLTAQRVQQSAKHGVLPVYISYGIDQSARFPYSKMSPTPKPSSGKTAERTVSP